MTSKSPPFKIWSICSAKTDELLIKLISTLPGPSQVAIIFWVSQREWEQQIDTDREWDTGFKGREWKTLGLRETRVAELLQPVYLSKTNEQRITSQRDTKMAQWVKSLTHKQEDLSLDSEHPTNTVTDTGECKRLTEQPVQPNQWASVLAGGLVSKSKLKKRKRRHADRELLALVCSHRDEGAPTDMHVSHNYKINSKLWAWICLCIDMYAHIHTTILCVKECLCILPACHLVCQRMCAQNNLMGCGLLKILHHTAGEIIPKSGTRGSDVKSHHVEVWLEARRIALECLRHSNASTGRIITTQLLTSKNGGLTELVWNSTNNTYLKVFWKCLYKQKGTLLLMYSNAWESNFLSEPTRLKWRLFPAQPAKEDGMWTIFQRGMLSNSSIISKTKKENSFSLFLFFQIKINYNPYLLINAGWSCP